MVSRLWSFLVLAVVGSLLFVPSAPAQAAMIGGLFSGTIYSINGDSVDLPISGTFAYDTSKYSYFCFPWDCGHTSTFMPTTTTGMRVTETSSLGSYVFSYTDNQAFTLGKDQINFSTSQAAGSSNYTMITAIFPWEFQVINAMPEKFSADLAPYQGSSLAYLEDFSYNFYITHIEAAPVPLPAALPLFALALAGGGVVSARRRQAQKRAE